MMTQMTNCMFIGALTKEGVKTETKPDECFILLNIQRATIQFKVDTGFPYRNNKVVTSLWLGCGKVVTRW